MVIGDQVFYSQPELVKLPPMLSRAVDFKIKEIEKYKHANVFDIIFNSTGFTPIKTEANCGGYFNQWGKEIAIHESAENPFAIFCHELGHFMHLDTGINPDKNGLLSYQVKLEQEAEAIGMKVYEAITGLKYDNITYFSKGDIKWLSDWYSGYYEVDLQLN